MKVFLGISLYLLLVASTACKKDVSPPTEPPIGIPEHFADLKVLSSFKWETTRHVIVQFNGYDAPVDVRRKLSVLLPGTLISLHTTYLAIDDSLSIEIDVPVEATQLMIQYGAIMKQVPIAATIEFSPRPEFE